MKVYLRLLSYARPIEKFAIPFFICTLLMTVFNLLTFSLLIPILQILFETKVVATPAKPDFYFGFQYFKDLFNHFLYSTINQPNGKMRALIMVCLVFLASTILYNLFRYLSQRIMEDFRIHTLLNLRRVVFDRVMNFHLGYFNNERKADIMARMISDVQIVQASITSTLTLFVKEPISLIGYLAVLFYMSFQLTIFSILVIPISGFAISLIVKRLKKQAHDSQNSYSLMMGTIDEALGAMRIVKGFNAIGYIKNKFHQENLKYINISKKMARRQELASPVSETLGALIVIGIVIYGSSLIFSNSFSLDATEFITYIVLFSQVMRPAKSLTNSFGTIQSGIASGERIIHLLDTKVEVQDKPDAVEVKAFEKEIEFKDVSFAYNKNTDVLKDVSFKLKKGSTIALVGPSGGGKSTISDLIPRFYDPTKGAITIDGIDLRDTKADSVRALMGIVSQEPMLFNDTIFNNIAFGKPEARKEEVIHAAKVANAHNFIIETEKSYDTVIGDRGVKLSGGQKQRLSIARAVLKNPPILLLDEATSALDTESEKLVQEALNNLMKNRTSLVIAHRLSTVYNADEILVLQNGKIVERGNHTELINNKEGLYKKLSALQAYTKNEFSQ